MTSASTNERQPEARIEVVEYDPSWPVKFEAERALLAAALAPWLVGRIEHIGSTAVPNLAAKPVIDIMAPVHNMEESRTAIAAATRVGYVYHPYKAQVMHWFCKPSASHRTHHLHLVPFDSPLWHERLKFRDALRQNARLASEYAAFKKLLAEKYATDREAYTEAKEPFIRRVLSEVMAVQKDAI